ncbi:PadR family transcriptional regulator [Rhodothermus profundi]|uniref:Transcriptional regulator, PadR family n=1 Tax=Rhodothermus profundi TaxID=633813 RepID=A0A1M6XRC8_9BACT|nr:PadR family transcriptional regulator [Rhodothermus profundi]SHL08409.1 transcriptional regulator, PadR family [Rhodothermus profundi]
MIDFVLLGLLAPGPRHAYALYQELRRPDGLWLVWRLKLPRLYAILDRLERAGLIRSELVAQSRRPTRRVFHLTPDGAARYQQWRTEPVRHGRDIRQVFLAKLYLARRDGLEIARTLLENQQTLCREWLATLRAASPPPHSFADAVWRYRVGYVEALLNWLQDVKASLV